MVPVQPAASAKSPKPLQILRIIAPPRWFEGITGAVRVTSSCDQLAR